MQHVGFDIVITLDEESGIFVAEAPMLPGCLSQGWTKADALENIKEAIELSLEVRREYGMFPYSRA